jgi:cellulose synthase/poly-beta-1,6-N-acetylglucosamine synthase-like glycosyltransferase
MTNREQFLKKHNLPKDTSLSLMQISKLSGMPLTALRLVYNKGVGAYHTNPESVRKEVNSPEQWAMGRVYAFVMKTKLVFYGADRHIAEMYHLL